MSDEAEFDRLLSRYLDGSVSAAELAQLESRLLADDEFTRRFSRWCLLHRQISELFTESAVCTKLWISSCKARQGCRRKLYRSWRAALINNRPHRQS